MRSQTQDGTAAGGPQGGSEPLRSAARLTSKRPVSAAARSSPMTINMERRALVALGLLWVGGVRANAAPDVTGLWSAAVRTRGGLGAQLAFTATDVSSTFGALVDFKYESDGARLKMTSMEAGEPTPAAAVAQEFAIENDKLTIMAQIMTRIGLPHPGAHPIVGDWAFMHYTGVPAVQRF